MNMKQNAALEMFEYLKEHLIPLAKDKGDKVYESDTTVQIARPENKSVWDCEKEVKQYLYGCEPFQAVQRKRYTFLDFAEGSMRQRCGYKVFSRNKIKDFLKKFLPSAAKLI